ncbi:MAG: tyrosine-type recombinase/integrase [Rhodospirillaceae bacterium]|nr:tyrosine-type recombinase/integrase [Rhodospirillaceae bacterium]MYI48048.1 tyrosine-type recombinase/integrase [Rhodospirillaceae bacterium]
MANRTKITTAGARAFAAADGREAVLWDSAAPGLGLRARANGRKTWIVHRRSGGSVVRRTLGALDALTVEDARHAARALFGGAEAHGTPAVVPTVRTFAPVFLADCAERWKPATRAAHADGMNRYILPALGGRRVDAVTAKDVRNWFDDLSVTRAGTANRALAVLSSMMKHAEALGLRREDSNPCKGLRRRKTGFEAHYLTDDEFAALGRALDDAEAEWPVAVAVVRFLLYTGARKSEALRLKWDYVHGDRAVLPDSKTGPRTLWLASPARAVLAARPRHDGCPWVFPSPCGGPATVDKAWDAIRAAAGLPTLRIHDLRHSHAAVAVGGGEGLRVVAGLLGHADIKTTFGYAHLAEDSVFEAANRVSRGLAAMLAGGEAGR